MRFLIRIRVELPLKELPCHASCDICRDQPEFSDYLVYYMLMIF